MPGTRTQTAVTVATTATLLQAENSARCKLVIANNSTAPIYVGGASVTTATGIPIAAGASLVDDASEDAWYAIVAVGTADVRVEETA